MQLSYKDIKFTIEAIDNLLNKYETTLDSEDIDEDEASDLGNDCMFLESLRNNLATNLKSDLTQNQPQIFSILEQLSSQELIKVVLELPIERQLALTSAIAQSFGQELLNRLTIATIALTSTIQESQPSVMTELQLEQQLKIAANLAIDDYKNDPELTIFTSLDGSDFLE
jgi:hypothetical protein